MDFFTEGSGIEVNNAMRRAAAVLMAVCLLFAGMDLTAQAAEKYPFSGYITMDRVYFRSGPSTRSASYGQLSKGTVVTVSGESGNFYSVKYQSRSGYILKSLVSASFVVPGNGRGYISQVNVYFRTEPSPNSDYYCQLALGTEVTVTGETGNYYKVVWQKYEGYIRRDCLSFVQVTPKVTPYASRTGYISQVNVYFGRAAAADSTWSGQLALGTRVTVTGETGNYYQVIYGGNTGYIRRDCLSFAQVTPAVTPYAARTGYISQVNVYFRRAASAESTWYGQLDLGTRVTVTGETGNYYQVIYGGNTGYIRRDCLSFDLVTPRATSAPTATPYASRTGYISQVNVYFRREASADSTWYGQLALGTGVTVTGETGNYYQVIYGGNTGYIRRDCLSFAPVTPNATAAPTATPYGSRTGYISQVNVYFRTDPSPKSGWYGQLDLGTGVTVTGETGNYYQVYYGGNTGYIRKDCLSFARVTPAATSAPTATPYASRTGYISQVNVYFRREASSDSGWFGQLALGTRVTVTGEEGNYYRVVYIGVTGYIRRDCLSFAQVTPAAATSAPTATPYASRTGYISQVDVYFRRTASADSTWYGQLALGTRVTVTGETGNYYQVIYGGNTGYIRRDCLSFTLVTPAATSAPTAVPWTLFPGKMTPTPGAAAVTPSPTAAQEARTGYISQENVCFRTAASADSGYHMRLAKGTAVTVIGQSGNYYRVYYAGYTGYIRTDCLSFTRVTPDVTGAPTAVPTAAPTATPADQSPAMPQSGSYVTEELDWFSVGQSLFTSGDTIQVKDCLTGIVWSCRVMFGTNHLDVEPLTASDTAAMTSAYGGNITYVRRSVLVKYKSHVYAGSIYGVPHGSQTIYDNNFDGQFCIHFTGSKTHGSDRVDEDHQACIRAALRYTW